MPTKSRKNTKKKPTKVKYHFYLVFKPKAKRKPSEHFNILADLVEEYGSIIQGSGYSNYAKTLDVHLFCTADECKRMLEHIKKNWGTPTVYKYSEDEFEPPYVDVRLELAPTYVPKTT